MSENLYCIHVIGPDDIHAMPSAESAIRAALAFNNRFCEGWRDGDVLMWANVTLWPYARDAHAEDLKRERDKCFSVESPPTDKS